FARALEAVKAAPTLEEKTRAFEREYEKAGKKHYDSRENLARQAQTAYKDAGIRLSPEARPSIRVGAQAEVTPLPRARPSAPGPLAASFGTLSGLADLADLAGQGLGFLGSALDTGLDYLGSQASRYQSIVDSISG